MTNNPTGASHNIVADLEIYDKFPRSVKHVVQQCCQNWLSLQVKQIQQKWSLDTKEWTEEMQARSDRLTAETARRTYGPSHPQAFQKE